MTKEIKPQASTIALLYAGGVGEAFRPPPGGLGGDPPIPGFRPDLRTLAEH